MRRIHKAALAIMVGLSGIAYQGCPAGIATGLLDDCFGEDTISASEYDDLNFLEQWLYEENDCGRYEPRSGTLDQIF